MGTWSVLPSCWDNLTFLSGVEKGAEGLGYRHPGSLEGPRAKEQKVPELLQPVAEQVPKEPETQSHPGP